MFSAKEQYEEFLKYQDEYNIKINKMLTEQDWQHESIVRCPKCDALSSDPDGHHHNNHPIAIKINKGSEEIKILKDRNHIYPNPQYPLGNRGVRITIDYRCEAGHVWRNEVQFHKGTTYNHRRILKDNIDKEDLLATIWRD